MADQNSSGEGRRWTIWRQRGSAMGGGASIIEGDTPPETATEVAPVSELERVEAQRDELRNSSKVSENAELKKLLEQEEATREGVEEALKEAERINDFDVRVALAEANGNTRAAQALYEELKAGVEEEVERHKRDARRLNDMADDADNNKDFWRGNAAAHEGSTIRLAALLNQKDKGEPEPCDEDPDAPWPDEISVSIPPKNLRNVRVHKATCETCGGRKWVRLDVPPPAYASLRCPDCKGSGAMQGPEGDTNCPTCEGGGESEKEERKETTVPEPVWILRGRTTGPPGVMESRTTEVVDGPPLRPHEGVRVIQLAALRKWLVDQASEADREYGLCEDAGPEELAALTGWAERAKAFRDVLDHLPPLQEQETER